MIEARSAGCSSARPACGHAQLDRGDRALDRVDVLPVDVALLERQPQVAGERPERALDAEPAEQARRADVDRDEAQRALDLVEAEVVDADDPAAVDVDDLLVHQVRLEQDLVRALLNLAMSSVDVFSRAPLASSDATDDQGRKILRRSVATTRPVTGG